MSDGKDIREDLQPGYEDYAHAGVKAGLSCIPGIGGPISEFFSMVIASPVSKRRDEWIIAIHERLLKLEEKPEDFSIENLKENDLFISVFLYATTIAMRTHQKEKIEALKNAVINAINCPSIDDSSYVIFLTFIDRYTPWHLALLQKMNDFYPPHVHMIQGYVNKEMNLTNPKVMSDFSIIYPELNQNQKLCKKIEKDLVDDGLIYDGHFLPDAFDPVDNFRRRTSSFGREFLNFIRDFDLDGKSRVGK